MVLGLNNEVNNLFIPNIVEPVGDDKDVQCKIATSNDTDAPSVNICEGVIMMVKMAKIRTATEKKVIINIILPWKRLMNSMRL